MPLLYSAVNFFHESTNKTKARSAGAEFRGLGPKYLWAEPRHVMSTAASASASVSAYLSTKIFHIALFIKELGCDHDQYTRMGLI